MLFDEEVLFAVCIWMVAPHVVRFNFIYIVSIHIKKLSHDTKYVVPVSDELIIEERRNIPTLASTVQQWQGKGSSRRQKPRASGRQSALSGCLPSFLLSSSDHY